MLNHENYCPTLGIKPPPNYKCPHQSHVCVSINHFGSLTSGYAQRSHRLIMKLGLIIIIFFTLSLFSERQPWDWE